MKVIKTIAILLVIIGAAILLLNQSKKMSTLVITKEKATISPSPTSSVTVSGQEYAYAYFKISEPGNLFLYPNFEEKESAEDFYLKTKCQNMINGGFYSESNQPIGLFISDGSVISKAASSSLFNGFFILASDGEAKIASNYSGESVRLALQSGPILMRNSTAQLLKLTNDKESRRMVVAIDKNGDIYFLAIYRQDSVFIGPFLVDLPEIVENIGQEIGTTFQSALNLDGGSASSLYTENTKLLELTPVGSFFCEK